MTLAELSRHKFVWTRATRSTRKASRVTALTAICLALATTAHAQIYSWRDANGTLVLSNLKPAPSSEAQSHAVPTARVTDQGFRSPDYVTTDRGERYEVIIREHARLNNVRPDLVRAVVHAESAFNPTAVSSKGAMGLMQLMPATARQFRVGNPFNPIENVRAGVAYLRELLDRYEDNEELALAAYNAGPTAVDRHGQNVPPYRETRNYITRINKMAARPVEKRNSRIFKVTEIVDGHPIVRYTDQKPAIGTYSVVAR